MSAYLVSNTAVNALATFAADQGLCEDPAAAALTLWLANREALRHVYADADAKWPELASLESRFRYERRESASPVRLLMLLQSYEHQAAQNPRWPGSEAAELLRRMTRDRVWTGLPQASSAR